MREEKVTPTAPSPAKLG